MIHYSCDLCKREIVSGEEVRYVVKLEAHAAIEPLAESERDDDRDHLEEIQEILAELGDDDALDVAPETAHCQFDLCRECYRKFIRNPLGRDLVHALDFSEN
jgi:hypothetical protein